MCNDGLPKKTVLEPRTRSKNVDAIIELGNILKIQ